MREPVTVIAASDFPLGVSRAMSSGFDELVGRVWMSCAVTLVTGVVDCVVTTGGAAPATAGVAEAAIKIAPVCRAVAARRLR